MSSNMKKKSRFTNNASNRQPNRSTNRNGSTSVQNHQNYHNSQQPNTRSNYSNNITTTNSSPIANSKEEDICTGVYTNGRFVHTITSLLGCLVEVQLSDGQRYEGILTTFSPRFDLCCTSAAPMVEETETQKQKSSLLGPNIGNLLTCLELRGEHQQPIPTTIVIDPEKIVKFKAVNVDMNYPTKKSMATDSEISKGDGSKLAEKELIPWFDDGPIDKSMVGSLEDSLSKRQPNGSVGWDSQDMLAYNKERFNLNSDYDESLSKYTIQLPDRTDEEYKQKEAHADRIAREIEQSSSSTQRYAKENEPDEETLYSAVIRDTGDEPGGSSSNSSTANYNHKSELNHHHPPAPPPQSSSSSQRDDRREMRNSSGDSNSGYRMQNRDRQNRNKASGGGRNNVNSGINEPNWREQSSAARLQQSRYHSNHSMPYGGNNPKANAASGGYNNSKYPPPQLNQYNSKSTYSAVSARGASDGHMENSEYKTYSNRGGGGGGGHSGGKDHYPEDSYSRRSTSGLAQRDNYKQRNINRITETEAAAASPPKSAPKESPTDQRATPPTANTGANNSATTVATTSVTTTNTDSTSKSSVAPKPEPKATTPVESSPTTAAAAATPASKPAVEKKVEAPVVAAASAPAKQPSPSKEVEDKKPAASAAAVAPATTESTPAPASVSSTSPATTTTASTTTASASTANTSTTSTTAAAVAAPAVSSANVIAKSSSLNPNAKSFTPRISNNSSSSGGAGGGGGGGGGGVNFVPLSNMPYAPYQSQQHMSTTPPSIPSTPGSMVPPPTTQFISIHNNSITQQMHHQAAAAAAQQQHGPVPRYNTIAYPPYNLIPPQLMAAGPHQLSQYILPTMTPGSMFAAGPVPGVVPTSQSGQGGNGQQQQLSSHHLISNSTGQSQSGGPPTNQQVQHQGSRGQYRGGKGNNHGMPQNSQPYMRGQHHDYQQSQVASSLTGQPIMAPPTGHQIPVAFSTAAGVHHHNQSGHQQPPNMSGQMGPPQPGPGQQMPYLPYPNFHHRAPISLMPQGHPQALNLAPSLQPGIHYEQIPTAIYCEVPPPQIVTPQSMPPPPVPQANMAPATGTNPMPPTSNASSSGPQQPAY